MTSDAIESLRADRDALLEIGATLTPEDWQSASGCPGWSVQDVVAHLGLGFWVLVDQARLPDVTALPTERAQDALVESRRDWDAAAVLADYEEVSAAALDRMKDLLTLDMEIPLGDLGTYQAPILPSAFAFDHYTHIRADLFAPRGPLASPPPASDELRLGPTLDWIEAALPQQNPEAVTAATLELRIHGTGPRVIRYGSGPAQATISSDGPSFVRWITQRGSWDELGVQAAGDQAALAVGRGLKVF
jgi:uncharacterized protein (TIGR03083 family)